MGWCTPAEAAPLVGVHRTTVMRQARAWALLREDGRLDLDAYRARRGAEINPLMQRSPDAPHAPPEAPAASVSSANAERTSLQAELLRLRLDREAGRQLDAAEVKSAIGEAGGLLRSLLGSLAPTLALPLARLTDPEEVERQLATAHDQVLRDFDASLAEAVQSDDEDELQEA